MDRITTKIGKVTDMSDKKGNDEGFDFDTDDGEVHGHDEHEHEHDDEGDEFSNAQYDEEEHGGQYDDEDLNEHHDDEDKKSSGEKTNGGLVKKLIKPVIGLAVIGAGGFGYMQYKAHMNASTAPVHAQQHHTIPGNARPPGLPGPPMMHNAPISQANAENNESAPAPLPMHKSISPMGLAGAGALAGAGGALAMNHGDNNDDVPPPIKSHHDDNDMATISPPQPVAPPAPVNSDVDKHLEELIDVTKHMETDLSNKFQSFNDNLSKTSNAITSRLDKTDDNVKVLGDHISSIDTRMNDFDTEIKDLESRVSKPVKETKTGIEHRIHTSFHKPVSAVAGYVLRGVEKGDNPQAAWLQTPTGYEMVRIGDNIKGVGSVKSIHPSGKTWVVETSGGTIHP